MKNQKAIVEVAKDLFINYFASATFPLLVLGSSWFLAGRNLPVFGLILIAMLTGVILGFWIHFIRTLKIRRTYLGKYDSNLEFIDESPCIEMMAITFAGFYNFEKHVRKAIWNNNSKVRVLLSDCKGQAFKQYVNKTKGKNVEAMKEECDDAVQILLDIKNEIQYENIKRSPGSKIKGYVSYEFFDSFPFRGCIISNKIIRYWPYLEHLHPSSSPTYEISRKGQIGDILSAEFEHIWNETVEQRSRKLWSVMKIVSGGQTGVDCAALDWAIEHNVSHGGWCPKGRLAENGVIDLKYKLEETSSSKYEERTELNVKDSDATVIFTRSPQLKKGSLWTLSCAKKYKKPWIHLVISDDNHELICSQLLDFLQKHNVTLLNIAGSRESEASGFGSIVKILLSKTYEMSKP